jgi:hypothetical protein
VEVCETTKHTHHCLVLFNWVTPRNNNTDISLETPENSLNANSSLTDEEGQDLLRRLELRLRSTSSSWNLVRGDDVGSSLVSFVTKNSLSWEKGIFQSPNTTIDIDIRRRSRERSVDTKNLPIIQTNMKLVLNGIPLLSTVKEQALFMC